MLTYYIECEELQEKRVGYEEDKRKFFAFESCKKNTYFRLRYIMRLLKMGFKVYVEVNAARNI